MKLLEITIDYCHKCDLETIIDPNNSQYFWINRRDLEIETKCNWEVILDNYKDLFIDSKVQKRINTKYYIST